MIEWIKLSSLIIDQIFNYGPKISHIFKSKEKKNKQFQLKILCNDIANEIQKSLLNDLKTLMDYSLTIPLKKENLEEINKAIQNILDIESEKIIFKMKDIIINQFNEMLVDNLLFTPKYHNLLIVGNNSIYKVINLLYNNKSTVKEKYEKFHLFSTEIAEFRPGLLIYALDIDDKLNEEKVPKDSNPNKDDKTNKEENNILKNMKKISNEILAFIKNQSKLYDNLLNRKISGIMICIDSKDDLEKIKQLIINLDSSIKNHDFELDLYLIIVNKCIQIKNIENIKDEDEEEKNEQENNIVNEKNNEINQNILNDIKNFNFIINDENTEVLDDLGENSDVEKFLNEIVKKYIEDYIKSNITNIHCSLALQFEENINYYYNKLNKEFGKAVQELKNFNLKNMPSKVEFDSQIRKIISDIFTNLLLPISYNNNLNKAEKNNQYKNTLSNQSLNIINELFNYSLKNMTNLTASAKNEYSKRVLGEVKEKVNELFSQLELDQGKKEKVDENENLKTNFVDNITNILSDKIDLSAEIYNLCLTYFYINKDLFKCLTEKIIEFCQKNIFENKDFIENIDKRFAQQMDSHQRRVLNID